MHHPQASGLLANRKRNGTGTLSTQCRTGRGPNTSSTRPVLSPVEGCRALSAMRRAPQLGQKPVLSFSKGHASCRKTLAAVTPGFLPYALRASLRLFKFVPDEFVRMALPAHHVQKAVLEHGICISLAQEQSLAEFHAWMTATPLAEVQATVSRVARNMLANAAVVGIVLGPLVALIRKVPREPSPR